MKKDKRILALVLAAAMMGTTALPVWAQTPETADSSVVEVEGTLENIIAAREALAAQPATLAEDDNNIQASQTILALGLIWAISSLAKSPMECSTPVAMLISWPMAASQSAMAIKPWAVSLT